MYCETNFKTKKALKEAVQAGKQVAVYQPGPFPSKTNGRVGIEGPHGVHKWYANAIISNGYIVKGTVK